MDGLEKLKLRVANETLGQEMKKEINAANYERVLDEKKLEVAEELGLKEKIENVGWENMTTKEVGKIGGRMGGQIGGQMVKKLVAMAENQMATADDTTIPANKEQLEETRWK
ncbi:hypothetical protein SPSIL_027300 [Sporomusa silvacetica DSM 10669]|uniref:Small, acid-soluble spore protein, alpha/beta type n=1 Tax=Sporomusa silvacetica DSM 10669 TaxID=1123289 RepID=A0ABZ3IMC3_9FIRM|nr:small, acid-soluble spore protein, alpha/beta type [Sporomusa silvacetica]OZC15887.1 small, acid-soluble spore protein alpha [Sporomusa silvacetica DSM 10669]